MGSTEQTKAGNLIIGGVLRLGQFATAPSGTEGALYFDTTDNTTKLYSSSAWNDLGGGWDGIIPNYTTVQRNALSLVDGLIVYNTTENAVQICVSGLWRNVGAKLSTGILCTLDGDCDSTHCVDGVCCSTACTGNCNRCNVASSIGTCTDVASDCTGNCDICSSGNCIANATLCTGNCDVCSGSGTAYSCAASASLCTGDCDTCSGSGTAYNCAASDALCSTCYYCTGSGTIFNCAAVAAGTSGYGCTALHYRCDGNGLCTAPKTNTCIQIGARPHGQGTCTALCPARGYTGCANGAWPNCTTLWSCDQECEACICWRWTY